MLSREQKIVMSIVLGLFAAVACVCLYGFTVGGEYFCVKYLLYCALTAFILTASAFVFIFKKENIKSIFKKEAFYLTFAAVIVIQFLLYQPLNLLSAPQESREYEVEITQYFDGRGCFDINFIDSDGAERTLYYSYRWISFESDDNNLLINEGGRMIIKDTLGGFNLKHAKLIRVTYDPEQEEE